MSVKTKTRIYQRKKIGKGTAPFPSGFYVHTGKCRIIYVNQAFPEMTPVYRQAFISV